MECSGATTQQDTLPSCSSGRRSNNASNSPEFEFWMVRNPSVPEPNLLSADELFVDGVLLPLHLIHLHNPHPSSEPNDPQPQPDDEPGPQISHKSTTALFTSSKRWKDMFKKTTTAAATKNQQQHKGKEKEKEKENNKDTEKKKKNQSNGSVSSSAELNINIWPFSRSRSAGNSGARPRFFPGTGRKVSSAPCSRSNSAGESKSKKWPSSPGRPGVPLGRSSPVWQVRRAKSSYLEPVIRSSEKIMTRKQHKTRTDDEREPNEANLNVPTNRRHLHCTSDENNAVSRSGEGGCISNEGTGGNVFSLRTLFTKKNGSI